MNKADLVSVVAQKADLKKKVAETAVNAVLAAIRDSLAADNKVQLVGFGTFSVKRRNGRKGRNPQTGKVIDIPAANIPVFKAGKELKNVVN